MSLRRQMGSLRSPISGAIRRPISGRWSQRCRQRCRQRLRERWPPSLPAPASVTTPLEEIQQRLARIEAQPLPGGPIFRTADKTTPLTPGSPNGAAGGQPTAAQRIQALEAVAGQIRDPQAQVALAAEMIRLQQEAAGMAPAMQVMPRAGRGWGE